MRITTAKLTIFITTVAATLVAGHGYIHWPRCPESQAIDSRGKCFTPPQAVVENYTPKGSFREFAGMKTYVTGDEKARKAVFWVHDIGGHLWKTLQGADILSSAGYLVVIPDFFFGQAIDVNLFTPPITPEKSAAIQVWLAGPIPSIPTALTNARKVVPALKAHYKETKKWGSIGLCWGAKSITLLSQEDSLFDNTMACHPSGLDPDDAPGLTVPYQMLASSGENATDVAEFKEILKASPIKRVARLSRVETWATMPHGWMGGTADLTNPEMKKGYEGGYRKAMEFLWKTL